MPSKKKRPDPSFAVAGEQFLAMAKTEFRDVLGRGKKDAKLLTELGGNVVSYWRTAAKGGPEGVEAKEDLRWIKYTMRLILEGQHVQTRRRINLFVNRSLKMGVALAKAVL